MATGGFKAKALIMSGNCDKEEIDALGGKFLGLGYYPLTDKLEMKFATQIRTDNKKTSRPKLVDIKELTDAETEDLLNCNTPLTKRKVLAFIMSQYDPLGLVAPLLLTGKLKLRFLYGKDYNLKWDDPLPVNLSKDWVTYIKELVQVRPFRFPRSVKTEECQSLWIVGFWDGSMQAHSASVYVRC